MASVGTLAGAAGLSLSVEPHGSRFLRLVAQPHSTAAKTDDDDGPRKIVALVKSMLCAGQDGGIRQTKTDDFVSEFRQCWRPVSMGPPIILLPARVVQ
jgi:hypothetical protein